MSENEKNIKETEAYRKNRLANFRDFAANDERTSSESGAGLTQTCSLSDLRSRLIARRRRARDPVRKARLQLTIDQLGSLISGKHGPDLPKLIKRQLALLAS
jgi:hypothetical protein